MYSRELTPDMRRQSTVTLEAAIPMIDAAIWPIARKRTKAANSFRRSLKDIRADIMCELTKRWAWANSGAMLA